MIERMVVFFDKPGPENTNKVIEAAKRRVEDGDIQHVIVASITGLTALKVAEALRNTNTHIVCVSSPPWYKAINPSGPMSVWPSVRGRTREKLKQLGVEIAERTPSPFDGFNGFYFITDAKVPLLGKIFAEILRMIGGQGFKTAVEVALMAVDGGYVPPREIAVSIGGTGEGADAAIVVKTTYSPAMLYEAKEDRLEIREILAMPMKKEWYW